MNKWIDRLVEHAHGKTDPGKLGYKTYKTPVETPENARQGSFVGFVGDFSGLHSENTPDADEIVERASIQEFDGNLTRDKANMAASAAFDRNRQRYEDFFPGRDTAMVEALYEAYISDWRPNGPEDLPACPPNTRTNTDLWRAWWAKLETNNNTKDK